MRLTLDRQGREPIYTQIADQTRRLVEEGRLAPGTQLPTIRELAAELGINFNTVARAYRILHEEGLICTQQGRGTYVVGPPEGQAQSRPQVLKAIVENAVQEAIELGFTREEVERAWAEAVAHQLGKE